MVVVVGQAGGCGGRRMSAGTMSGRAGATSGIPSRRVSSQVSCAVLLGPGANAERLPTPYAFAVATKWPQLRMYTFCAADEVYRDEWVRAVDSRARDLSLDSLVPRHLSRQEISNMMAHGEEQERREAAKYGRPLRAAERQAIRTAKLDAQRRRNGGGRR